MKEKLNVSRRNVLLGIGTVGIASAGAGLGTTAYFSDQESFTENAFTAGKLDLTVDYTTKYNGAEGDDSGDLSGSVDGRPAVGTYTLGDVKPGDSGCLEFCFEIEDNPAYMWACGDLLSNGENNRSGLERSAGDDSTDVGELADSIDARLLYCENGDNDQHDDDDDDDDTLLTSGTLTEVLQTLSTGVPLDARMREGILTPGRQKPYTMENRAGNITGPCLCLEWSIDFESVGNEIQSDSIEFDLAFHALQARHSDGTINPCPVKSSTIPNFPQFAYDGYKWNAQAVTNNQGDTWNLFLGNEPADGDTDSTSWRFDTPYAFTLSFDHDDGATFEVAGKTLSFDGFDSTDHTGTVGLLGKSDNGAFDFELSDIEVAGRSIDGPTSALAENGAKSGVLLENIAADEFAVSGTMTFLGGSGAVPRNGNYGLNMFVEYEDDD
ncbi:hypothetical protein AUR64_01290 [Haloprofundus marisrubri]|uniref:SipW-cognate class signal peptide n=1 Tax=Haloprofundus marisrubri TaxID=1514971 RepID=A0A0W1R3J5_9EURY|nr:TasA family protein [Haloprofundus marisrubri]KTG07898.1 hypothetical protein AUR64_01290 [Haloprofundus marisrubri]